MIVNGLCVGLGLVMFFCLEVGSLLMIDSGLCVVEFWQLGFVFVLGVRSCCFMFVFDNGIEGVGCEIFIIWLVC